MDGVDGALRQYVSWDATAPSSSPWAPVSPSRPTVTTSMWVPSHVAGERFKQVVVQGGERGNLEITRAAYLNR